MSRLGFLLLLALIPVSASAWTPAAEARIAAKSAALAPPDLRMLLEKFDGEYRRGLERAAAEPENEAHRYFVATGRGMLRERIDRETQAAIRAIRKGDPMADVVSRLGGLVHLIADANNPFHVGSGDARLAALQSDYEAYLERRMTKFPTVFYGLDRNFRLRPYLDRTFARSARFYPLVAEEYFRGGRRRAASEFDDRSTAFGIASVSYSRSVSDVVNLYYYIWKEAGGDVRSAAVMRGGNLLLNAN